MGHVAVTVIDGDEHVLNPYNGSYVKKMEKRGNSAFYYVSLANSMYVFGIYKDLMPLKHTRRSLTEAIVDVTFLER